MKLGRSLNAAANKDPVFPPQKKHQLPLLPDVCFGSSNQQGAEWWRMNLVSKRSPQAQVAMVETAEDKFSVAAAHWGLELMSVPANVACHQNPIELFVLTVSCSGNFFPWLHTGLLETGLGVDGQRNPRKNCRVWGQMTNTACTRSDFFGRNMYSTFYACLLLSELNWEIKLSWMDYSHNPKLEIEQDHCLQLSLRM